MARAPMDVKPPRTLARGGHGRFELPRIGALAKGAAFLRSRRVSARADHGPVLDLFDHIFLVARVERLDPRRLRRIENTATHRRHLRRRFAATLIGAGPAHEVEAMIAGTPL